MASDYQVTISMSSTTVKDLQNGGYSLYGFKAVQSTNGGGAPLVWFKVSAKSLSLTTEVAWQEQYQAYVSKSSIIPNGEIKASNDVNIDLGQEWKVDEAGAGPVVSGSVPTAIEILNTTSSEWPSSGISQMQAGEANPLCAFPLYGNQMDVIAPIEKVLFMFATNQVDTGTVIFQAFTQGLMIDLTSDNERGVSYDINQGWSWGGYNWGQSVPPSTNLVPFLIESPSAIASRPDIARKALTLPPES